VAQHEARNRGIYRDAGVAKLTLLLRPRRKTLMEITSTAEHPFEKCCLDIVGSLIETDNGNKCVLTFQDDLSKNAIAVPIHKQDTDTVS
jgi:hypothetical protein